MHTITRYHDISCGHRVVGHEGKCRHLHGHNYRITFFCAPALEPDESNREEWMGAAPLVRRKLDDVGRVIDFGEIKTRLCQWLEDNWDHKFLVWQRDGLVAELRPAGQPTAVSNLLLNSLVWVPFNPTAENMAQYLVDVVGPKQLEGTGVALIGCKVDETRKCSAQYLRRG